MSGISRLFRRYIKKEKKPMAQFYFGERSESNLATCHPDLVTVARAVIEYHNITVVWGWRDKEQQNLAYDIGNSTKKWPESKHNKMGKMLKPLSEAMDLAPWFNIKPHIRWGNEDEFIFMAGKVLQVADMLGIPLIWGGDWDKDDDLHDQTFFDGGHFEIIKEPI